MAEYSRLARGSFTTGGSAAVAQVINLPFQPTYVKLLNYTAYSSPAEYAVTQAFWDIAMGQDVAAVEYLDSGSFPWAVAADYIPSKASGPTYPGGGISTFSGGLLLQYGNQLQISSTTKGTTTTITTAAAHGLSSGNVVILEGMYQSSSTGMPQMSLMPFVITVTTTTAFTVNWNSNNSNYTNLSGSPAGAYVRQVLYPFLYLPGENFISAISLSGANVVVTTTSNHNFVVGQEIAFRIPPVWGITGGLNSLPNNSVPGSPIYFYVTAVGSNTQFTCSALSANVSGSFATSGSGVNVASAPGLQLPQVVAVGDVNSGGAAYSGGNLYPSPSFPTYSGGIASINGPAIQGAYVNNTSQGFVIGGGYAAAASANASAATAPLLAASSLYVWEAYLFDIG